MEISWLQKVPAWVLVASTGLVPLGIALADQADQVLVAPTIATDSNTTVIREAERVIEGLGKASRQLEAAIHVAERDEDQLLVTCLEAKREEMAVLRGKALVQFRTLEAAATLDAVRAPQTVLTGVAQQADAVLEAASRCVGADDRDALPSVYSTGVTPRLGGELPTQMPRVPTIASPTR